MTSYACYVHVAGEDTPHLRVVISEGGAALIQALHNLIHEWPGFKLIDVRDDSDRVVVRYVQTDHAHLLRSH